MKVGESVKASPIFVFIWESGLIKKLIISKLNVLSLCFLLKKLSKYVILKKIDSEVKYADKL